MRPINKRILSVLLAFLLVMPMLIGVAPQAAAAEADNFMVDGTSYATLEEAAVAVSDGGTITMQQNVSTVTTASLTADKSYTIDLGGYTLSNSGNVYSLVSIWSGVVTVTNGTMINSYGYGIDAYYGSGLVLRDGLEVRAEGISQDLARAIYVEGAELTIINGTYMDLRMR